MKSILLIIAAIISTQACIAQVKISIARALTDADSVIIISHKTVPSVFNNLNEKTEGLFINGMLNTGIITERHRLTKKEIASITDVLTTPLPKNVPPVSRGCYDPHHAIIMFKQNTISFLEICFKCYQYVDSGNLEDLSFVYPSLEKYFKNKGLRYEL